MAEADILTMAQREQCADTEVHRRSSATVIREAAWKDRLEKVLLAQAGNRSGLEHPR